ILLCVVLACGGALLTSGKYPAIDERGLHLAPLPAELVNQMTGMQDALQTTLAQWIGRASELFSGLLSAQADRAPIAAADISAVAARQVQILVRLDALAATVDTLQGRLDRQQAARMTNSETRQADQALQMKAVQAQLAELQQAMAAASAMPVPPVAPSRDTVADRPTTDTGEWVVNVASSSREASIKALQQKLEQQDIRTELLHTDVKGEPRFRLRVTGFTSSGEARRYATRLEQQADLKGAWASKR
ncbi:MAG: SPOR domain-containing protein, partial [Gammaproteobacteria bacterium]